MTQGLWGSCSERQLTCRADRLGGDGGSTSQGLCSDSSGFTGTDREEVVASLASGFHPDAYSTTDVHLAKSNRGGGGGDGSGGRRGGGLVRCQAARTSVSVFKVKAYLGIVSDSQGTCQGGTEGSPTALTVSLLRQHGVSHELVSIRSDLLKPRADAPSVRVSLLCSRSPSRLRGGTSPQVPGLLSVVTASALPAPPHTWPAGRRPWHVAACPWAGICLFLHALQSYLAQLSPPALRAVTSGLRNTLGSSPEAAFHPGSSDLLNGFKRFHTWCCPVQWGWTNT